MEGRWLYRLPKLTKNKKYGENADLFIERGTIFYLRVGIGRGTAVTVEVFQYRLLGMYKNIYNKGLMNGKKKTAC